VLSWCLLVSSVTCVVSRDVPVVCLFPVMVVSPVDLSVELVLVDCHILCIICVDDTMK